MTYGKGELTVGNEKKQRYNIKKVTMEGVERRFNEGMDGYRRVQREVGAVQRMAGTFKEEFWESGLQGVNDFIWGPKQNDKRSRDRQERHEDERPRERRRSPSRGNGSVEITIEIHDDEIIRAMEASGIDPESVPHEFFQDVRNAFKYQLTRSIENNIQTMLVKTVEVVDEEYSRTYGRKN